MHINIHTSKLKTLLCSHYQRALGEKGLAHVTNGRVAIYSEAKTTWPASATYIVLDKVMVDPSQHLVEGIRQASIVFPSGRLPGSQELPLPIC